VLVRVITWDAGDAWPIWKLKVAALGLETSIGLLLTTSVTVKVCGELPEPVALTETFSAYVFGASPESTVGSIANVRA
jgi:hypothetical protein